ncbi:hypothetical protein [Polyangium aurulentum]|uniref:hypothetical protein n=1 Tax=Polyangium aurulentum TaxID=2567896 RepID=UPI0010AE052E|nr:hypothetical protein [Polyangium aurulentum]UQA59179.1 hypothetical protein E8A73_001275 [Polyangium aurulentum]
MKFTHALFLAVSLQISALPSARAEPEVALPDLSSLVRPEVLSILERAQRAEREGNMDEALRAYQEAHQRNDCAAVTVELALAELRAGFTVTGARHLRYGILIAPLPLSTRSPQYLTQKLVDAKRTIGTLLVRTNIDKASLDVDGAFRWEYPDMAEIYVTPDEEHKITATREGYWTSHTTAKVGAGETKDVLLAMEPQVMQKIVNLPTRVAANVSSRPPEAQESKTLLYVSAAGLAVSLGAGGIGGLVLYNSNKETDPGSYNAGLGLLAGGVIGFGLSVAGLVVYGLSRPTPQPVITIAPEISKNQTGLGLRGTW